MYVHLRYWTISSRYGFHNTSSLSICAAVERIGHMYDSPGQIVTGFQVKVLKIPLRSEAGWLNYSTVHCRHAPLQGHPRLVRGTYIASAVLILFACDYESIPSGSINMKYAWNINRAHHALITQRRAVCESGATNPCVKSLRSSFTGLYPQMCRMTRVTLHGVVSAE